MPRSLLWPDPRVKPPPGSVRINWGHPLTNGLFVYWLFNEGGGPPIDLCQGIPATFSGTPTWTADTAGVAGQPGTSNYFTAVRPAFMRTTVSSCFTRLRCFGGDPTENPIMTVDYNGSKIPIAFAVKSPNFPGYGFFDGSAFRASGITTAISNDGKVHDLAGTYDGSTLGYWVDGKSDATSSFSGSQDTANVNNFSLGQYVNGASHLFGVIYHLGVYGRALTAGEVQWLAAEPYAMCQPVIHRRYFVVPSGFQAAWAVNATRIVDAGSPYVP